MSSGIKEEDNMYKLIIGEIKGEKIKNWQSENKDLYDFLEYEIIKQRCRMGTLPKAAKAFRDEVQLDWGTFVWRASKPELLSFFKKYGYSEEKIHGLDDFKEYGVVYLDQ